MFANISRLIKQITSISNPELWFYSFGLYLFGFILAVALFPNHPTVPLWQFILYFLWMVSAGMVFGLSHHKESAKFIFPWEILFIAFRYLTTGKRQKIITRGDPNVNIATAISSIYVLLFILANGIFPNVKILFLGLGFFVADFLYNSRHVNGKFRPFIDVLLGGVYGISLFIGYVAVTGKWPDILLIIASILYCVALEAHSRTIEVHSEHLKDKNTSMTVLGKEKLLFTSIILIVLCGAILASYNILYFLMVIPFLAIFILSLLAKNREEMLKIYNKIFFIHTFLAFFVISYFFATSPF
ncbi:MAG: UbiA family prenyltransferase [Patescibacteria group bacterium]